MLALRWELCVDFCRVKSVSLEEEGSREQKKSNGIVRKGWLWYRSHSVLPQWSQFKSSVLCPLSHLRLPSRYSLCSIWFEIVLERPCSLGLVPGELKPAGGSRVLGGRSWGERPLLLCCLCHFLAKSCMAWLCHVFLP